MPHHHNRARRKAQDRNLRTALRRLSFLVAGLSGNGAEDGNLVGSAGISQGRFGLAKNDLAAAVGEGQTVRFAAGQTVDQFLGNIAPDVARMRFLSEIHRAG